MLILSGGTEKQTKEREIVEIYFGFGFKKSTLKIRWEIDDDK